MESIQTQSRHEKIRTGLETALQNLRDICRTEPEIIREEEMGTQCAASDSLFK